MDTEERRTPTGSVYTDGKGSGELVKEIAADVSTLVRKEIELARHEISQIVKDTLRGATVGAIGLILSILVLPLLALLAIEILAVWLDRWASTLIVTLFVGAIAAGAFVFARRIFQKRAEAKFTPERTVQTIKEDVEWARSLKKR